MKNNKYNKINKIFNVFEFIKKIEFVVRNKFDDLNNIKKDFSKSNVLVWNSRDFFLNK